MYKALIVDDENIELQAIRYIIERDCPQIAVLGEAAHGEMAVKIAAAQNPDIILMDIRMPGMNGIEATRVIKAAKPDVRVVFLTAFDEFKYAQEALSLGVEEYLLKPVRPQELARILEKLAAEIQAERQREAEDLLLRKKLDDTMPFIKMLFVQDLITGNIEESGQARERAEFLGLTMKAGMVMIVDIDRFRQITRSDSETRKQILKQQVYEVIKQTVAGDSLVLPLERDSVIVLLGVSCQNQDSMAKHYALQVAQEIRGSILHKLKITVTIGIGRTYDEIRDMQKSYIEATSALRQSFFLGQNQIIHVDDIPYLTVGPFTYPFQYEKDLLEKIRCADKKGARAALEALLGKIFSSNSSIEVLKACALEILVLMSRSAVEGGASLEELTLLNYNNINELSECANQGILTKWMVDFLNRYMDKIQENQVNQIQVIINKACKYIEDQCNHALSLEEVAGVVHLSPFYFSRLFKKETGCKFIEFVTRCRMEKAKVLLARPDNNVVLIARQLGYNDPSYFCKVFRQEVGFSPNRYRQRILDLSE